MVINNRTVLFNFTVALFNYNCHKFFYGEEIRISSKKTSTFQEWCQMTPFMVHYALIYCEIYFLQRFLVCVSIVDFWFAVILKFWYESICIWDCFKLLVSKLQVHLQGPAFVPTFSHDVWFWWYNCGWMISYL